MVHLLSCFIFTLEVSNIVRFSTLSVISYPPFLAAPLTNWLAVSLPAALSLPVALPRRRASLGSRVLSISVVAYSPPEDLRLSRISFSPEVDLTEVGSCSTIAYTHLLFSGTAIPLLVA